MSNPTPTEAEKVVADQAITPDELREIAQYACWDKFEDRFTSDPKRHPAWRAAALIESQSATIERVEREAGEHLKLATEHLQARYHAEAREHNAHLAVQEERKLADAAQARVTALEAEKAELRAALISAREQLEGYELDATGETYNDTRINAALAQPSTQENDNGR